MYAIVRYGINLAGDIVPHPSYLIDFKNYTVRFDDHLINAKIYPSPQDPQLLDDIKTAQALSSGVYKACPSFDMLEELIDM